MTISTAQRPNTLHLLAAFGSGGLLTTVVLRTGEAARHGGPGLAARSASSSWHRGCWLIARIGAVNTAPLVIGGQMVSGVVPDLARGAPLTLWASALGVLLVLEGAALTQKWG